MKFVKPFPKHQIWCRNKNIVAEQSHCSLHVKELKVTTTELERQAGD